MNHLKVFSLCCMAAILLMAGCTSAGSLAGAVNADNKNFKSSWTMEISPLTGGKKEVHYIDLIVKGNRFFMHRKEPMEMPGMGFGPDYTFIHECDVVFDGKILWEFNRKAYTEIKGKVSEDSEWNSENNNSVVKFEPDKTALETIKFWNIPNVPTEVTAKDTILARQTTVLTCRARSPLGEDTILTFWVDPSSKLLLKRQDSVGGQSSGKGTDESIFGRQYTCTELQLNPGVPADRFTYKPKSSDKIETLTSYPFTI